MSKEQMEGGLRRKSSLDMMNAAQVCTPTIRVTLQEVSMIDRDMPHEHTRRKESQKYLRESYHHRIKCTAATFLATFMWRRPLNSTILATTTHKKPKRISDGTCTQVRTQMINKCRMKIVQMEIYNVKDTP